MKMCTTRGLKWELRNSWWVLPAFLSFGVLSFFSYLYVGVQGRNPWWKVLSGLSLLVVFAFGAVNSEVMGTLLLFIMFLSVIHLFIIRKKYLIQLDTIQLANPELDAYKARGVNWEIINSWWMFLSLFSLGTLSFISYLWVGFFGRNRRWMLFAALHVVALYVAGTIEGPFINGILGMIMLGSIAHLFMIRKRFLMTLDLCKKEKNVNHEVPLREERAGVSLEKGKVSLEKK